MKCIYIDGNSMNLEDFVKVSRHSWKTELKPEAKERVNRSRELVDRFVDEGKVVYGITTGFGKFSDVVISAEELVELQRNLIVSHSCGVGEALPEEAVRGIMLLRANALAKGFSGIRLSVVETLIAMLNKGVHPVIPEKGSLGASGDLAPLAHMVLVMIGEGEAVYEGTRMPGRKAMDLAGIPLVTLVSKEGLALINGTQVMTSIGGLAVFDAINLSKIADISAALSIEALNGITDAMDKRVHAARGHKGQISSASNILRLLENSTLVTRQGEKRVQDPYSLRCTPQIHGATKDALEFIREKVEIEMNAATDNPIIFPEEEDVISGGNFHGQPIALPMDFLGIAAAELANISERRLERLVNPTLSNGLPAFLTEKGGVNSGFMIVQYSAASLVSENKVLAHPASVDSIPSSANQEDHVSMGTIAARKARSILDNSRKVIAMELLAACQAIDLRKMSGLGRGTEIAYNLVRQSIPSLNEDRVMYLDINKSEALVCSNRLVEDIESELGVLE